MSIKSLKFNPHIYNNEFTPFFLNELLLWDSQDRNLVVVQLFEYSQHFYRHINDELPQQKTNSFDTQLPKTQNSFALSPQIRPTRHKNLEPKTKDKRKKEKKKKEKESENNAISLYQKAFFVALLLLHLCPPATVCIAMAPC